MVKQRAKKGAPHVRGEVVLRPLADVKPNGWNPNVVPLHIQKSIERGFKTDGWIASHALLVWGKDDKGETQNLIIDGEHRWTAANAVGLGEGPMVFLDGITEAQAKALTVKMNQKRGVWDDAALGDLLKSIQDGGDAAALALDLGFEDDALGRLLASTSSSFLDGIAGTGGGGRGAFPQGKDSLGPGETMVAFNVQMTPTEHETVVGAVIAERKHLGDGATIAQALVAICTRGKRQ